jgi:exonuclease III
VLTWNVQHAGPARSALQADWLARCRHADVIALTEVAAGPAGEHLAAELVSHGYATWLGDSRGRDYRVLIGARVGELDPLPTAPPPAWAHRWAAATLTLPDHGQLGLVALYVPSRGPRAQRNLAKRAFQDAVATQLPALRSQFRRGTPVLVAGDLNVVEPDHQPRHAVFGRWEYDFYRSFATAGFTDAFRHHHPGAAEHSWFGRSGAGYRFDHIFCATDHIHRLSRCRYLHQPRTAGLSDHAALVATIAVPVPPI